MNISETLTKLILKFKFNKPLRFVCYPIFILLKILLRFVNWKIKYYNDLFSNVTGGSLVAKIKDIPGKFEIDARSHILKKILINKSYEPVIVSIIKANLIPDKDAVNVGANIGIYAVLLASLINMDRKVLAVEPTPLAFRYLTNNFKRNDLDSKVVLYNGICTDKKGKYDLNIIEGKEEYSSIGESFHLTKIKEKIVKVKVEGDTINNLVTFYKLNPGIIVIDVEGSEMKVLKGASDILIQYKPIIILELVDDLLKNQESSSKEVIDFLEKSGYIVCDVASNKKAGYPFSGNIIARPISYL
jgi:methyltransferase, FkbM family